MRMKFIHSTTQPHSTATICIHACVHAYIFNIHTLLVVKTAAQLSVGPSVREIMVPLILRWPIEGASTETKVPSALPVANPFGRPDAVARYATYSA